jgi:hypothetical protein
VDGLTYSFFPGSYFLTLSFHFSKVFGHWSFVLENTNKELPDRISSKNKTPHFSLFHIPFFPEQRLKA